MLTKGFITAIPTGNSNKYQVRLPFFENAVENSSEVIYEATLNYTPGIVGGYNVGDCVYCLFEDNDGGRPVISGKLYTKDGNYTGALVLTDNLTVNKSATLPPNTTVGNVTADNIKALTGVRSNLQWQLNDIDDRLSHIGGTVDTTMSDTSTNPVQNMVIKSYTDILLANKVDKITGKGLSTNDYTDAEKTKLTGIATGAEVNVIDDIKVNGTSETITDKSVNITVPTAISDLTDTTATTPVAKAITAGSITTESKTVTYSSMTSGVTVDWFKAYKTGKVVTIYARFSKSTATASGRNALTCSLTNMSGWLPPYNVEGLGFYASCGFGIRLKSDGSVKVRNISASSSVLTDGIQFNLTYVI